MGSGCFPCKQKNIKVLEFIESNENKIMNLEKKFLNINDNNNPLTKSNCNLFKFSENNIKKFTPKKIIKPKSKSLFNTPPKSRLNKPKNTNEEDEIKLIECNFASIQKLDLVVESDCILDNNEIKSNKKIYQNTSNINPSLPSNEKIVVNINRSDSISNFLIQIGNDISMQSLKKAEDNIYSDEDLTCKRIQENSNSLIKFKDENSKENILISMDFSNQMLQQINSIRNNPLDFCKKIKFYSKYIVKFPDKIYLIYNEDKKYYNFKLNKGLPAFNQTINLLKNLSVNMINEKLKLIKLIHLDELKIPFPEYDNENAKNNSYIKSQFKFIREKLKGKYEVLNYHYDITYKDSELSILMQIIDDNFSNKKRQKNLLRLDTKYVGINYGKIENNLIVVYLVFAK
jgi:hypothetical protein